MCFGFVLFGDSLQVLYSVVQCLPSVKFKFCCNAATAIVKGSYRKGFLYDLILGTRMTIYSFSKTKDQFWTQTKVLLFTALYPNMCLDLVQ